MLQIRRGDLDTNLVSFIDAIEELRASGFCAHLPMLLGLLATEQANAGDIAKGMTTLDEAMNWSGSRELHWYGPELLRIKAEIILHEPSEAAHTAAEAALRQSLGWAREQGALSWELRTATSLARLWDGQNRRSEALALLQPVYDRFTEGFDTADLKAAKALLYSLQ